MTEPARVEDRYRAHLVEKEEAVRTLFNEAGIDGRFSGIVPSPVSAGHRARARFSLECGAGFAPGLKGFDPWGGPKPFAETAWILPPFAREIVLRAAAIMDAHARDYPVGGFHFQLVQGDRKGHLRLAVERLPAGSAADYGVLAQALLSGVPGLCGVAVPSRGIEAGTVYLEHEILGRRILSHHGAFFQSNYPLTEEMVRGVVELSGPPPVNSMADLYCGVGAYSCLIASPGTEIFGADQSGYAVASAERNRQTFGLDRAAYHCRRVETLMNSEETAEYRKPLDLVILNPPRAGCGPGVIRAVAGTAPLRVVSVSCNPVTHVEDLGVWRSLGYVPQEIRAFDMFPFTRFCETVTVLTPS